MADLFSLRAHAVATASSAANTLTCQIFGVQQGDLLTAQVCFPYDSSFNSILNPIQDNVNSQPWSYAVAAHNNPVTNQVLAMLHLFNSQAGDPTLTVNFGASAAPIAIFFQAWNVYGATSGLSQAPNGANGTSSNPASGSITPNVGELVIGIVQENSATPTPGTGYAQIDADASVSLSWTEYLIQGSATAATWIASSDSWSAEVATYVGTFDPQTPNHYNAPDRRVILRGY